ncbi:Metal-dependent hydrolase [Pararobbsia alpina]|uniref:metal-dependent hydrolase n=1 Tax=Pararobbsia alpina TaxID=621374 RepID=UPI0039A69C57
MASNLPFERRDIRFGMDGEIDPHWLDGDAHRTRFYDAMSLMFPEGEKFFIESVRMCRDFAEGDPILERDVRAFIGQEAMHRREHIAYNERVGEQGAPVAQIEAQLLARLNLARSRLSRGGMLGVTICLEHFTAMLADQVLRHPATLRDADPAMQALWQWHALEETEHKAVAFDLYVRALPRPFERYLRRCNAMLIVTPVFISHIWSFNWRLVKSDGQHRDLRGWLRLLYYQFISPGPFVRILPQWLAWFRPGFHPWKHDNRALIGDTQKAYDALARTQTSQKPS